MGEIKVKNSVFFAAFKYSMPVLFGYITIGAAFGLVVSDAGYRRNRLRAYRDVCGSYD